MTSLYDTMFDDIPMFVVARGHRKAKGQTALFD